VAAILLLTLATAAAAAVEPLLLKHVFDSLASGRAALRSLLAGVGALAVLALLREAASGVSNLLTWRTRLAIHERLLDAAVEKLHRLPAENRKGEGVGAVMTRLDRSIQGFIGAVAEISFNVLPALCYLGLAVFAMLRLDWRMTLVVLFFAPLLALVGACSAPVQTRREKNLLDRWAGIYSRFNEVLSGILTVRSLGMEDAEKSRFMGCVRAANRVVSRGVGFDTGMGALQGLVVAAARVAAIGFGGLLVLRGEASLGTLVAFLGYVGGLFGPVQGLTGIYRTLRTASVSLGQIFAILDGEDEVSDLPLAREAPALTGRVEFRRVGFAYNGGPPVLSGIDLDVAPGELVALVGPSGAGKSTLVRLLQRLADPTSGAVLVDGTDLRELRQKSLRRQMGVVLQEALLFNESVAANIAYGRPGATREEIEAAAGAANAHGFIIRLEQGYETPAGERGCRFSGGERQRIAIARALLRQPPILILDEATSALDAESEAKVQEALERLVRGRTTFVIAHRLSTVVKADRILVLRNGRIVESGRHEDLMDQGGYYASLVERQVRGLIGVERRAGERRAAQRRAASERRAIQERRTGAPAGTSCAEPAGCEAPEESAPAA